MRKPYNNDSLGRGLDVHQRRGIVKSWKLVPAANPRQVRWLVSVSGDTFEFTAPQVYAFCVGCASTHTALERQAESV